MAEYDNRVRSYGAADAATIDVGLRAYMLRVYNYMLMGLGLTGLAALFTLYTPAFANLFFTFTARGYTMAPLGWVVLLAPLGLVFFLSFRIQTMSFAAAQATFWVYAALMGIGLTPVMYLYTGASVAQVFFVTSATFGAMSLYGYTTKRDLSGLRLVPVHGPDRHHHRLARQHVHAIEHDAVGDLGDRRADLHRADRL